MAVVVSPVQNMADVCGGHLLGVVVPKDPLVQKATLLAGDCRVPFLWNFNTLKDTRGLYKPASDVPYITILDPIKPDP